MQAGDMIQAFKKAVSDNSGGAAVLSPNLPDGGGSASAASMSFGELDGRSDSLAAMLESRGVSVGMRALVLSGSPVERIVLSLALLKLAAVPVVLEPGMELTSALDCLASLELNIFAGTPSEHLARLAYRRAFKDVKVKINLGRHAPFCGLALDGLNATTQNFTARDAGEGDVAMMMCAFGDDGRVTAQSCSRGALSAAMARRRAAIGAANGQLFVHISILQAIMDVCSGVGVCLLGFDKSSQGGFSASMMSAAAGLPGVVGISAPYHAMRRFSRYCMGHGMRFPGLRHAVIEGVEYDRRIHDELLTFAMGDGAETYSLFGTPGIPCISLLRGSQAMNMVSAGISGGYCAGRPLPGVDVAVMEVGQDGAQACGPGEIGELRCCVEQTMGGPGGDLADTGFYGSLDGDGMLWLCGTKKASVNTDSGIVFNGCCEALFNALPGVRRSAVVNVGNEAVAVVEQDGHSAEDGRRILEEAGRHACSSLVKRVLFIHDMPMLPGIGGRIDRPALASWATSML